MSSFETIHVPTKKEVCLREINASQLSENDLRTLRMHNLFMYHSIPAVHRATITLQEVKDAQNLVTQGNYVVTRKSRVSTEGCMESLMEEFLQDDGEILDAASDTFEFELLGSALLNLLAGESGNEQQPEQ